MMLFLICALGSLFWGVCRASDGTDSVRSKLHYAIGQSKNFQSSMNRLVSLRKAPRHMEPWEDLHASLMSYYLRVNEKEGFSVALGGDVQKLLDQYGHDTACAIVQMNILRRKASVQHAEYVSQSVDYVGSMGDSLPYLVEQIQQFESSIERLKSLRRAPRYMDQWESLHMRLMQDYVQVYKCSTHMALDAHSIGLFERCSFDIIYAIINIDRLRRKALAEQRR